MSNYKTIRKNAFKMQDKIFASAYDCVVHSLSNNFIAEPVENIQWLKKDYQETRFAKMDYDFVKGLYTIHYHSNLWYYFKSKFKPKQLGLVKNP